MTQVKTLSERGLKALDSFGLPKELFREIFSCLLILRWLDLEDAEQEAMAAFEDRTYHPLLPSYLQWRNWAQLEYPHQTVERLRELTQRLEKACPDATHPVSAWLRLLAPPLLRLQNLDFLLMHDLVHWVGELAFETPEERRNLETFFAVLTYASDGFYGQFSSPENIARLVAALGNPMPGERVYDPCFGWGTFLVAAWQQAERSRGERRRPGPLLEVAAIELNPSAFLVGLARMLLAGIEAPRLELGNSLEREQPNSPNREGFDLVLASPPLGSKTADDPRSYRYFSFPTKDSVGLFVQHTLLQLKPHGRAVLVVPEGFLFRGGPERELRRYLVEQGHVEAVIGLPAGAFLPYTGVTCDLLVLSKRGGISRVRMVDAAPMFETRSGRKAPFIRDVLSEQLANELRRPELRQPVELSVGPSEGAPGTGLLSRSIWEVSAEELASSEWDLSPRRREKGGLDELLSNLKEALGKTGTIVPLPQAAQVSAGRNIKSADLLDEAPNDRAIGYIRIKDLTQGRVGRCSSWLKPAIAAAEQRSALLPGDVLVSKSGTIGKIALVRNGAVGSVAANGLYVLRADPALLDPVFLMGYLSSPACQNWLNAQSRGTVIQHLNRLTLDQLPVPLPPLQLQARAAAQFRDFGTDVLEFLGQAAGTSETDRVSTWLAELSSKTPILSGAQNSAPPLTQLEQLAAFATIPQRWFEQEQIGVPTARWLTPLTDTLFSLVGVSQIPPGSGLLLILQDAERGFQSVRQNASGHLAAESQARAVAERLLDWMRSAVADLVDKTGLRVRSAPASLIAGSFAEFAVELDNGGVLPLRAIRVQTSPDWGTAQQQYLSEHGTLVLNLRCDVPKISDQLSLKISWSAANMNGREVNGEIELALKINEPEQPATSLVLDLGSSPYVTGSPLEPHSGQAVFFGREKVLGQIRRQIASHGNVVLLEGNRRAGKTSILKHLEGRDISGWLAVYSSLQGAGGAAQKVGVPTSEVFREIACSIAAALARLGLDTPLPNGEVMLAGRPALGIARACREGIGDEAPFADFREYLEIVLSFLAPFDLGLLLMLDEFDKLQEGIDNGVTSPQVPENIRYLIQTYQKFSAILTGSRRLKRLREEYWSALYGLGTSVTVTTLDAQSARAVVTEPVRNRLVYSNEAIERVVNVTARHPYLLQCLCNGIFDYAVQTRNPSVTLGTVNDVACTLVRDNEHFATLWDYAGQGPVTGRRRRQLLLVVCARNLKEDAHLSFASLQEELVQVGVEVEDEMLATDLVYLRELELIDFSGEISGGQYRLSIPMMADWIEHQQDADVVVRSARTEAEEENA